MVITDLQFLGNLTELDLATGIEALLTKILLVASKKPNVLSGLDWEKFSHIASPIIAPVEYAFNSKGNGARVSCTGRVCTPHMSVMLCGRVIVNT